MAEHQNDMLIKEIPAILIKIPFKRDNPLMIKDMFLT